ncbi:MAG: Gfo/Idh/MocA family oxidoreductase [Planctomycetia bacterium]|nr:Gfo/Idh/MocA family oxidoreductase [Planctomycetia bacterium]
MLRLAFVGPAASGLCARIAPRLRNARFTAVVDSDLASGRAVANSLGAEIAIAGFDKLLADRSGSFDAVVLEDASKHTLRQAVRAAEAGKHVFFQAPLAHSHEDAMDVIAACSKAKVRLMVGNELRFAAGSRIIKASLDDGKLGQAGLVRIHHWEPRPPVDAPPGETEPDRDRPALLLLRLIGELDLACWYFGGVPERVYAVSGRHSPGRASEPDYVQVHLGFTGDGMALIDYCESLPTGDRYFSQSLIGSTGAAYADDHHNRQLLFGDGCASALGDDTRTDAALRNLQEFVDAVCAGREPMITGEDALRALDVGEAAAAALQSHDAVPCGGGP